ncbi:MAG: radical SAM protein [Candidatus Aminicenantaceae bacterium]
MPKIVLIEPRAPDLHIYSRFKLPRLGLLILGALMRDRGWEVDWIFEEIQKVDFKQIREADLVGISTITSTAPRAYLIADRIRDEGIPVLLGGPHVTFLADEGLQHADFVIRGEGEQALMRLIDAWEADRDFSSVPNLSYVVDGEVRHNALGAVEEDLDRIPFPDLSALLVAGRSILGHQTIPVQTSRGCPYDCAFCSVTGMFGRGYRFRSPQNVIEELRQYDSPKNHIFFYDDNFAANPKRLKELLLAMQEEEFSFTWSTQVRADIARREDLVRLMRQTGCSTLYIGLESVNPLSLESMNKRQTLAQMEEALQVFRRHHIPVHGMFVYGFDEDDWKTVRETVRFAKRTRLSSTQFLILTPLPGSEFYRRVLKEKRLLFKDWGLFDAHHVVFKPKLLSLQALQKAQMISHKRFYSLIQSARKALRFRWFEVAIARYARGLNRMWKKRNKAFISAIKLLGPQKQARITIDFQQKIELD